jgi:hypothetical protein
MKRFLLLMLTWLSLSVPAWAGDYQKEIDHLLNYIKTTPCQYERNGQSYKGSEAVLHVQKKYDYFKDKIASAEDFVRLCATKSELSGKAYHVQCPNEPKQESATWLLKELKKFRAP